MDSSEIWKRASERLFPEICVETYGMRRFPSSKPIGSIHFNPDTKEMHVNTGKGWEKLVAADPFEDVVKECGGCGAKNRGKECNYCGQPI